MLTTTTVQAFWGELEKISADSFGSSVGKSYGATSSKGGFSTSVRSAGTGNPLAKPPAIPKMPGVKSFTKSIPKPPLPKAAPATTNNLVNLKRGLSNITTPST